MGQAEGPLAPMQGPEEGGPLGSAVRLLHTADVHLGARHDDLGEVASAQRERQFAAFARAADAAVEHAADVFLICGDLFDSNTQPRRSVERAAGELHRLAEKGVRSVLIPGTHDCYDAGSIYRSFDLRAMAKQKRDSDLVTVLTSTKPDVFFEDLDLLIHGFVSDTKTSTHSPLSDYDAKADDRAHFKVGMIHGSLRVEGKVEADDVLFTAQEVASSGLDYLALGHWHSFRQDRAGRTIWAYSGAPEAVAVDQDGAGRVLLVTLETEEGRTAVAVEPIEVGRTRFLREDVDVASIDSQDALVRSLGTRADPNLVLEVRLLGVLPDSLDLDTGEVEQQLKPKFFGFRLRNTAVAPLPEGIPPPPDTIAGVFTRELRISIAAAEVAGAADVAAEQREALHLLRVLLEDPKRVTLV